MIKFLKIIGLIFIIMLIFINGVYARDDNSDYFRDGDISESDIDFYKPNPPQNTDYDEVNQKVGTVLGAIQVIGTIVSVAVLMILGIKFMIGSVEEKAEYKRAFIPYLIGAAILFTGTTLPNIIYNWSHQALG